ncbi:MAG TPA: DUF4388 domain-containing protein [Thermoanaerobaculia bacterium]|nr:DUF4388 domain-containing protein [Thermoanaerobaculia bacterium]
MEEKFRYTGDLAQEPLPEVLRTIHFYRVPGVLTVESGGVTKKVYLLGGNVIFATSSDRAESLGQYLRKSAVISSGELKASLGRLDLGEGRRHGELLVEMGILTDDQLRQIVTEQVKAILYSAFSWEQGSVTFEVGRFKTDELIRLDVPTPQAILDGIRRLPDPRRCVSRLGPSWTIFDRAEEPPEMRDVAFTPAELVLLSQVDGRRTLRDLITLGPGDLGANAKLVYAFWVLRLISRRETQSSGIRRLQWKTSGGIS